MLRKTLLALACAAGVSALLVGVAWGLLRLRYPREGAQFSIGPYSVTAQALPLREWRLDAGPMWDCDGLCGPHTLPSGYSASVGGVWLLASKSAP